MFDANGTGLVFEIAAGTMFGILGAAAIALMAYRWYRLAAVPNSRPRALRYATILCALLALLAISSFAVPILREQYAESQRRLASAKKEADEREYCSTNRSIIIGKAGLPDTSPPGPFARTRAEYENVAVDSRWGTKVEVRTAYGWLALCKRYGIISHEEFDRVLALQKETQDAYDAPELAKKKELTDKLTKWLRGE